jgi:hypothetical protein
MKLNDVSNETVCDDVCDNVKVILDENVCHDVCRIYDFNFLCENIFTI